MNRKILVALLILPLLVFAADQAFTAFRSDSGGKEKSKPKSETASQAEQAQPEANLPPSSEPGDPKSNAKTPAVKSTKMSQAELVRELKQEMKTLEEPYFELYDGERKLIWPGENNISKATKDFLDKTVLKKLKKANPMSISLAESFSRCPSAYYYNLVANEDGTPSQQGWMVLENGCSDEPIAVFRYDEALTQVQVKISDKAGYVPIDEFFVLLKKAVG